MRGAATSAFGTLPRDIDVRPAVVAGVERHSCGVLPRGSDLPEEDLVVGDVMLVSTCAGAENQVATVIRHLGEILVTEIPRKVEPLGAFSGLPVVPVEDVLLFAAVPDQVEDEVIRRPSQGAAAAYACEASSSGS